MDETLSHALVSLAGASVPVLSALAFYVRSVATTRHRVAQLGAKVEACELRHARCEARCDALEAKVRARRRRK